MTTIHLDVELSADRPVADLITERGKELPVEAGIGAARDLLRSESVRLVPLLDTDGRYVASITREAIEVAGDDDELASLATTKIPVLTSSTPLRDALVALEPDGRRAVVVGDDGASYVGLVCLTSNRRQLCVDAECHAPAPVDPAMTVAALVLEQPGRTRVFERFGVDYCCGGQVSLTEACRLAGIDTAEVVAQLEVETAAVEPEPDWTAEPIEALVTNILDTHHAYLRAELPPLAALVDKVTNVHGERHPELHDIRRTFAAIDMELRSHMPKEEIVAFPACLALAAGETSDADLEATIEAMVHEHAEVGEDLARLRSQTRGYAVPDDACNSYRSMLDRLATLEADTHRHIHKENNILFPRALAFATPTGDSQG